MNEYAIEQLSQQIEACQRRLVAGAADLPESVAPLWHEVQKEIAAAVAAVEPVKRRLQQLWAQRELTIPARQEQAQALMVALNADVNARLQKADRTLAEIAYQLQEGITPGRPDGVTQVEVIDRKEDIRRLLERAPSVELITQLMVEAIDAHDALTAYCLTPDGPLSWTYKLLSIDRSRLRSALFRAIRETRHESVPGEQLLRCYEASHEDMTSWTQLKTAISGLVNAVGEGSAGMYRAAAIHGMGWGTTPSGEPQVLEAERHPPRPPHWTPGPAEGGATVPQPGGVDLAAALEASRAPRPGKSF